MNSNTWLQVPGRDRYQRDPDAVRNAAAGLLLEVNARTRKDQRDRMTIAQLCAHIEQKELKPSS
jgi:hypothetical protein